MSNSPGGKDFYQDVAGYVVKTPFHHLLFRLSVSSLQNLGETVPSYKLDYPAFIFNLQNFSIQAKHIVLAELCNLLKIFLTNNRMTFYNRL
jgi:hypothetical protein